MPVDFKLPDIGEGVAEGEITRWIVHEGDPIREDQPMVEVMTDKATVEITSPVTGRVQRILHQEGAVVPVHTTIVILEEEKESAAAAVAGGKAPAAAKPTSPALAEVPVSAAPAPAALAAPAASSGQVLAAPATRKLARERGVDLAAVPGSGPGGRVTREDVQRFVEQKPARAERPAPAPPATPALPLRTFAEAGEERLPYRGIRKATGDQMVRSAFTAPHFTYVDEVDMTALHQLRRQAAEIAAERGVKFTFLPFIIQGLCAAIRRHPSLNATLDEERGEVVVKRDIHVGIAAETERGLMVPVVRNADQKSALEIAADVQRLTASARAGSATREELTGSTITITSAGSIGGLFATPIINFPEVAILGVYQIKDKPVIREGAIVPGKIGYLSLTLDHRVVDGATAAHAMNHLKRLLENPGLLLLEA